MENCYWLQLNIFFWLFDYGACKKQLNGLTYSTGYNTRNVQYSPILGHFGIWVLRYTFFLIAIGLPLE